MRTDLRRPSQPHSMANAVVFLGKLLRVSWGLEHGQRGGERRGQGTENEEAANAKTVPEPCGLCPSPGLELLVGAVFLPRPGLPGLGTVRPRGTHSPVLGKNRRRGHNPPGHEGAQGGPKAVTWASFSGKQREDFGLQVDFVDLLPAHPLSRDQADGLTRYQVCLAPGPVRVAQHRCGCLALGWRTLSSRLAGNQGQRGGWQR